MHEVLDELGVRAELLSPEQQRDLDELGYCRFDRFLDADRVAAVLARIERLLATAGRQGGTLHLKGLLDTCGTRAPATGRASPGTPCSPRSAGARPAPRSASPTSPPMPPSTGSATPPICFWHERKSTQGLMGDQPRG